MPISVRLDLVKAVQIMRGDTGIESIPDPLEPRLAFPLQISVVGKTICRQAAQFVFLLSRIKGELKRIKKGQVRGRTEGADLSWQLIGEAEICPAHFLGT